MPVNQILKNIDRIDPLPSNIRRIMDIVNDSEADMKQLAKIVEEDPALTMKALSFCNSAYYCLPVRVDSVSQAVRFLGLETVGHLAMAAYFRGIMHLGGNKSSPWLKDAGEHLLMAGQIAEKLSRSAGGPVSPSTAFTAGILHDVGKLVFSKLDDIYALEVRELVKTGGMTSVAAEREILGMDHAEAGAHLAKRWEVSDVIVDAIRYHHDPLSKESISISYVFLSDRLYYLIKQGGDLEFFFAQFINYQAMEATGLSQKHVQEAIEAHGS